MQPNKRISQERLDQAGGEWAQYGELTGPTLLTLMQQDKLRVVFANKGILISIQRLDGVVGDYYLAEVPVAQPPSPASTSVLPELTSELDKLWSYRELKPLFAYYAGKYGFDPLVLAAIAYQESGFKNWRVHADGTGYGLFGLDDNGMLPAFEQWSGLSVGRGGGHAPTTPNQQIEFTAMQLRKYQDQLGNAILAAQAWHRGLGAYQDELGVNYGQLIRTHMATLASQ